MSTIGPYSGAPVSQVFRERWMTSAQLGDIAPVGLVEVRRGQLLRSSHPFADSDSSFGVYVDARANGFYYPDWQAVDDWTTLDSVQNVKLDQSFDSNGITTATIKLDNLKLTPTVGAAGILYHVVERGYYSPERGLVAYGRPDPGITQTPFFRRLPNAQIRVRQGYGADEMVTTFLGLVDDVDTNSVPNEITLTCRDFGCVLTDEYIIAENTEGLNPPLIFTSEAYTVRREALEGPVESRILVNDISDIVRSCLRWAGFKGWEVENAGTGLASDFIVDSSMSLMDVINTVKNQTGFTFFITEPRDDSDDLDIGYPVFRNTRLLEQYTAPTEFIDDSLLLTDAKLKQSNLDDRSVITTVGSVPPSLVDPVAGYLPVAGDLTSDGSITFTYRFPIFSTYAGVIRPIRHTDPLYVTFSDVQFAAILIALQIALAKYTATLDLPANPGIGIDTLQSVIDRVQGINSRVYVSNRTQEMQFGPSGYWTMELGGALVDTPEIDAVVGDWLVADGLRVAIGAADAALAAAIERDRIAHLAGSTPQQVAAADAAVIAAQGYDLLVRGD